MFSAFLKLVAWLMIAAAVALLAWFDWRIVAAVLLYCGASVVRYFAVTSTMRRTRADVYTETPPRSKKRRWPRSSVC